MQADRGTWRESRQRWFHRISGREARIDEWRTDQFGTDLEVTFTWLGKPQHSDALASEDFLEQFTSTRNETSCKVVYDHDNTE